MTNMQKTTMQRFLGLRKLGLILLTLVWVIALSSLSHAAMKASSTSVTVAPGKTKTITLSNVAANSSGYRSVNYSWDFTTIMTCSLGDWSGANIPLKIKGVKAGNGKITVTDGTTTITINVTVANTAKTQAVTYLKLKNYKPYPIAKKKLSITFKLAKAQSKVKVQVLNANNKVVWQKTCKSVAADTPVTVTWNGKYTSGKKAASGFYRVRVIAGSKSKLSSFFQAKR